MPDPRLREETQVAPPSWDTSGEPSTPDPLSEADADNPTGEIYQPWLPAVPLAIPFTSGGVVSTFADRDPIRELSPQDDSAQNVKSFCPCAREMLCVAPEFENPTPLRVPSMAVIW